MITLVAVTGVKLRWILTWREHLEEIALGLRTIPKITLTRSGVFWKTSGIQRLPKMAATRTPPGLRGMEGTGPLWLVEKTQTSAEEEAFLAKM